MARVEIERALRVSAPAAAIWERCYADPGTWPEWNPEIVAVRHAGPITAGATVRVRFRTGARLRFRVIESEAGRLFTDETRLPGARMGHRHVLEPEGSETLLRNTIYFDGTLARIWERLLSRRVAAALEDGQRRIASLAMSHAGTHCP